MKNRFRGLSESRKLKMLQMTVEEIYDAGYADGEFTSPLVIVEKDPKRFTPQVKLKSPNQRRAELIQRAREFVEKHLKLKAPDKNYDVPYLEIANSYGSFINVYPRFRIDEKKRTVVLLLKGAQTNRVRFKGIAKCHPDEVFNADIGKAIALARALEIEIPQEFMDAVQPDEKVAGMRVFDKEHMGGIFILVPSGVSLSNSDENAHIASPVGKDGIIIDDTQAEYEVPSC